MPKKPTKFGRTAAERRALRRADLRRLMAAYTAFLSDPYNRLAWRAVVVRSMAFRDDHPDYGAERLVRSLEDARRKTENAELAYILQRIQDLLPRVFIELEKLERMLPPPRHPSGAGPMFFEIPPDVVREMVIERRVKLLSGPPKIDKKK